MNKELLLKTFRNTLGAALYIFLVTQIMQNGEKLFGKTDNMLTGFVILLLFCLSAGTVGGLVFGQSVILFIEKKAKEGIQAAIYSIGWLAVFTLLGMVSLYLLK